MDGRIERDKGGGQVRLVGGYTECILIRNYPTISTGITVAFVAPIDTPPPLFGLVEPIAPCIETNIAANSG